VAEVARSHAKVRRVPGPTNGIRRFFTLAVELLSIANPQLTIFVIGIVAHRDGHHLLEIPDASEADPGPRRGRHPILTCSTARLPICPRTRMSLQMWLMAFVNTSGSVPLCTPRYMQARASHPAGSRSKLWINTCCGYGGLQRLHGAEFHTMLVIHTDIYTGVRLSLPCTQVSPLLKTRMTSPLTTNVNHSNSNHSASAPWGPCALRSAG